MLKDIALRGLTTTPSAHDCADGDIAAMANLINEDGALKPLHQPYKVGEMEAGAQMWVHETPDFFHLIKRDASGNWWWTEKKDAAREDAGDGSSYTKETLESTAATKCSQMSLFVRDEGIYLAPVDTEDAIFDGTLTVRVKSNETVYSFDVTSDDFGEDGIALLSNEVDRRASVRYSYEGYTLTYEEIGETETIFEIWIGDQRTLTDEDSHTIHYITVSVGNDGMIRVMLDSAISSVFMFRLVAMYKHEKLSYPVSESYYCIAPNRASLPQNLPLYYTSFIAGSDLTMVLGEASMSKSVAYYIDMRNATINNGTEIFSYKLIDARKNYKQWEEVRGSGNGYCRSIVTLTNEGSVLQTSQVLKRPVWIKIGISNIQDFDGYEAVVNPSDRIETEDGSIKYSIKGIVIPASCRCYISDGLPYRDIDYQYDYVLRDDRSAEEVDEQLWNQIYGIKGSKDVELSFIGYVIIVAEKNEPLQYLSWDGENGLYVAMGQKPDFKMDFMLEGEMATYDCGRIRMGKTDVDPEGSAQSIMGYEKLYKESKVQCDSQFEALTLNDYDMKAVPEGCLNKGATVEWESRLISDDPTNFFVGICRLYKYIGIVNTGTAAGYPIVSSQPYSDGKFFVYNDSDEEVYLVERKVEMYHPDYGQRFRSYTRSVKKIRAKEGVLWSYPTEKNAKGFPAYQVEIIYPSYVTSNGFPIDETDVWSSKAINIKIYKQDVSSIKQESWLGKPSDTTWYAAEMSENFTNIKAGINRFNEYYNKNLRRAVQPFFVKYGVRKKGGGYLMESSAILMCPNWKYSPLMIVQNPDSQGVSDTNNSSMMIGAAFVADLKYKILTRNLALWEDIIECVDIAVSKPIDWNDQSQEYEEGRKKLITYKYAKENLELFNGMLRKRSSDEYDEVYNYFDNLTGFTAENSVIVVPPVLREEDYLRNQLLNVTKFYVIKTIEIEKIDKEPTDEWQVVTNDGFNYGTPESSEISINAEDSNCSVIMAKGLKVFNSRVHAFGVSEIRWTGLGVAASPVLHTPNSKYRMVVSMKKSGKSYLSISDWIEGDLTKAVFVCTKDATITGLEFLQQKKGYYYKICPELKNHPLSSGEYSWDVSNFSAVAIDKSETDVSEKYSIENKENNLYVSGVDDPFNFPANNVVQVGRGEILAIATNNQQISEGQFGDSPLYVFTSEETWVLSLADTGVYQAKQPIANMKCINPDAVCELPYGVVFVTANGIMYAQGAQITCISDSLKDNVSAVSMPHLGDIMTAKGLTSHGDELTKYAYDEDWMTFLKNCGIAYDGINDRLLVYPHDSDLTFVYSMKSQMWGMQTLDIKGKIDKANACWIVTEGENGVQQISDVSSTEYAKVLKEGSEEEYEDPKTIYDKQFLITRPLGLDAADTLKRVTGMIANGYFRKGHVATAMYGSRDLFNWKLVWTSKDHYLRGFSGTPFKYYSVVMVCDMDGDERLQGLTIDIQGSLMNQIR